MSIFKKATLTKIVGATVLTATAMTAASPAMAQGYYYGHRDRGDTTGAAVAGGIIGLALGAIVASSIASHNDHNRYADRGWTWRDGYYWDREGRRYYKDGRAYDDGNRNGYYDRRGYDDRGYGQGERGYYGRDTYYGNRTYRYGY